MKRYPLQMLVQLRAHRAEAARMVVLEKQRAALECLDACTRIEGEVTTLQTDRQQQRARLLDPAPPGMPLSAALSQREAHIDLLAEQIVSTQQRLANAQETLRLAEVAVQDARDLFFRAKARQDALEKRRDVWRSEQHSALARQEEAAADDLQQSRFIARH